MIGKANGHYRSQELATDGTSTASPNTKDALSGEIDPTRVADIAIGAKVADALANIDWVMPMVWMRMAHGRRLERVPGRGDRHHQLHSFL